MIRLISFGRGYLTTPTVCELKFFQELYAVSSCGRHGMAAGKEMTKTVVGGEQTRGLDPESMFLVDHRIIGW